MLIAITSIQKDYTDSQTYTLGFPSCSELGSEEKMNWPQTVLKTYNPFSFKYSLEKVSGRKKRYICVPGKNTKHAACFVIRDE